jgi:hypothetical protein
MRNSASAFHRNCFHFEVPPTFKYVVLHYTVCTGLGGYYYTTRLCTALINDRAILGIINQKHMLNCSVAIALYRERPVNRKIYMKERWKGIGTITGTMINTWCTLGTIFCTAHATPAAASYEQ